jgi:hypothetical protein
MDKIKNGDYCKCEHDDCNYVGFAFSFGTTQPWCQKCGENDKLIKVEEDDK